jgi:hypothetical protein
MPTPVPASLYPLLMDLINQTYLDRVEQIQSAQVDDSDNIIAAAVDGRKLLAVRVTDEDIAIRLRSAQASATQFAAPKGKKNCRTGISCGASCISSNKTCRKKTTPKQKAQKQKIVAEAKAGADEAKGSDRDTKIKNLRIDKSVLVGGFTGRGHFEKQIHDSRSEKAKAFEDELAANPDPGRKAILELSIAHTKENDHDANYRVLDLYPEAAKANVERAVSEMGSFINSLSVKERVEVAKRWKADGRGDIRAAFIPKEVDGRNKVKGLESVQQLNPVENIAYFLDRLKEK